MQNQYASQSNPELYAPVEASIPRYCFAEDKYWFVIEAMLEDGRNWELSRYYEDFYDFQIALLTEFPAEAGNTGTQKRTLPYMPGPVNYVTDAITEGRLHNLDHYVKNLLNQPPYISRCNLVKQFFAPREGDYEITRNANGEEYRLSQGSQLSASESPTGGSRQNSRNNLSSNGYSGPSATPRQMSNGYQGKQHSDTYNYSILTNCEGLPNQQQLQPDPKIKVFSGDDLFAFKMVDIQFDQLRQKIKERLESQRRAESQRAPGRFDEEGDIDIELVQIFVMDEAKLEEEKARKRSDPRRAEEEAKDRMAKFKGPKWRIRNQDDLDVALDSAIQEPGATEQKRPVFTARIAKTEWDNPDEIHDGYQ